VLLARRKFEVSYGSLDQNRIDWRAVYLDGQCVRSGLPMSEADKLARDLINQSFAHPRL